LFYRKITIMTSSSLPDPQIHFAFEAAKGLPRWQRGWAVMRPCRALLLSHAWQVAGFCLAISVLLWMLRPGMSFLGQLAYSLPMGLTTWLLIDGGRFFIDQDSPHLFPRGWLGGALILGGVLMGFACGTLVGGVIHGHASLDSVRSAPQFFAYTFLLSIASGIGISLFFYAQGKSAHYQAELEIKSRQATQAQLKLLQSQLDPHMLFNTLANLRVLIQQDPARAVHMLDQLNDFLRSTLAASRASEHSLQAEFDRLQDYLALMQIRMADRLSYQLDLPPDLASAQVPTLILQSLVENAILHGLEPKIGGGHVAIRAHKQAQQLVLQVADNGLGFDAAQVQEGFGITQVRERLHSRYGAEATIDLIANNADFITAKSQNSSGCAVSERLPHDLCGCQVTLHMPLSM
jgi:Histidine kinase